MKSTQPAHLNLFFVLSLLLLLANCKPKPHYDIVIRNGLIVDGTGSPLDTQGDVAI